MVEQMINLSKYGLGKRASILTSAEKKPLAATNSTISEVLNDNKNGPPATKSATLAGQDDTKYELPASKNTSGDVHVDKRPRPSGNLVLHRASTEAGTRAYQSKSPPGSSNMNNNLVYARRKSDAESINLRNSDKNQTSGYQPSDKRYGFQAEVKIEPKDGIPSVTHIPVESTSAPVRNCENDRSAIVNFSIQEQWNSRFNQLQKYLKQCDSPQHEVYVQKLRSFSRDECCRHAVELEKRAIQLMLEEGRELKRVKELNILGKPDGHSFEPQTSVCKSQKL